MNKVLCLNKGTKVTLENGALKKIEYIEINDKILSYNFNKKVTEIASVEKTAKSHHSTINRLIFSNGEVIECTTDHPIYTNSSGWCSVDFNQTLINYDIQVGQLKVGQKCLMFINKRLALITLISIDTLFGEFEMFDISGGKNHCFFANGILVHDENLTELPDKFGPLAESSSKHYTKA